MKRPQGVVGSIPLSLNLGGAIIRNGFVAGAGRSQNSASAEATSTTRKALMDIMELDEQGTVWDFAYQTSRFWTEVRNMFGRSCARYLGMALLAGTLAACADSIPRQEFQLSPESLQQLQMQSRYFETGEEAFILSAAAAVLQDMGFNLDESETELGVMVASKKRDATQVGQIAGSIAVAIFTGEFIPVDDHQTIRASLVTQPSTEGEKRVTVRIIFQRIIWNTDGYVSKFEPIDEPEIYQEFFSKLSKSVFREARSVWQEPK